MRYFLTKKGIADITLSDAALWKYLYYAGTRKDATAVLLVSLELKGLLQRVS